MKPFRLFSQVLLLLGLVMVCAAGSSKAAMQIDIYGPGQNIVNLAMAAPLSTGQPAQGLGKELDAAIHDNLSFLPFMRLTDPKAVLGGTTLPGYQPPNVDFKRFQLAGADLLVTAGWPQGDKSGSTVELRVYETFSGQFVFGNAYSGVTKEEVQDVADRFCADLMKALTGHGDFFLATCTRHARLREEQRQEQARRVDHQTHRPQPPQDHRYPRHRHVPVVVA